jgi:hypothetical protein
MKKFSADKLRKPPDGLSGGQPLSPLGRKQTICAPVVAA